MSTIESQLSSLEKAAAQLVEGYQSLRDEQRELNQRLEEAKRELMEKNSRIVLLENELKNARVVQGLSRGGEEAELAKAKIGSLVREIDRCIAMLNG